MKHHNSLTRVGWGLLLMILLTSLACQQSILIIEPEPTEELIEPTLETSSEPTVEPTIEPTREAPPGPQ